MPILNTRDIRATRFESNASTDAETNILKGPFVNISLIVGISRGTSCTLFSGARRAPWVMVTYRPIYTVRFFLTIVACDFCSARCSRHGKIVYDFYDIKLPVATIVVGF